MTKQVKVFFVFLAFTAIVSVFSFFDILGGVRSAKLFDDVKPLPVDIAQDADQDGLSDADESYWNTDFQNPDTDGDGFLDGEEVASENDPREKADHELGDNLTDTIYGTVKPVNLEKLNITDSVGELLAGAISDGDVTRAASIDRRENSLGVLSSSVITNFYMTQGYSSLPLPNIISRSKKNQIQYVSSLATVIGSDLIGMPALNPNQDFTEKTDYFSAREKEFRNSFDKITTFSVPDNWVDVHNRILDILDRFANSSSAIVSYESDIIKATLAFNELGTLNNEARSIVQVVHSKIKENQLSLDNKLFEVMDIIYKY